MSLLHFLCASIFPSADQEFSRSARSAMVHSWTTVASRAPIDPVRRRPFFGRPADLESDVFRPTAKHVDDGLLVAEASVDLPACNDHRFCSLFIPRLNDILPRDFAAFEFAQCEAKHFHSIGISAGLAESDLVCIGDACFHFVCQCASRLEINPETKTRSSGPLR